MLEKLKIYFTKFYNSEHRSFIKKNKFIKVNPSFLEFSKKSVAGSVAVGLFCGLIPAPFQMLTAATVAYWMKLNIPIAIFTTLYTNPVTVIPIYLLCFKVGMIFLNFFSNIKILSFLNFNQNSSISIDVLFEKIPKFHTNEPMKFTFEFLEWLLFIGYPLLIGTIIVATSLSFIGYLLTNIVWDLFKKKNC